MSRPRSIHGPVFLTVFLDIAGFAVLFPLFPAILDHYLELEGTDSLLGQLHRFLMATTGDDANAAETLFGGILGSVYGLLQFAFTPFWGSLSDRHGRRPILLLTLSGTVAASFLWIFAGNFTVLIVARILAGMMAGNISTASAALADCTESSKRIKVMGLIGAAIGLGFIFGPALGGLTSLWILPQPTESGPLAINPFSGPALVSFGLALLNLLWVANKFPETLASENRATGPAGFHPFSRLSAGGIRGVKRANLILLGYLTGFAAMEFTVSFLAVERFSWTIRDLAWLFVFVGLVIAFVQGGLVRRIGPRLGELRIIRFALPLTIPGILLVGLANRPLHLYAGLAIMAIASAFLMPSLSALVSRYAPANRQGLAMGSHRATGSLSRAIGPILGGLLYWRLGSAAPYWAGSALLVLPFVWTFSLPKPTAPGETQTKES